MCASVLTFGAISLLTAGTAHADELKDKAQQLLSEGNELASEGDFGNALVKFRTAYELYPSPKLLLNIGTSLRQIGRNAEAAETYEVYLDHPEADSDRADELRDILDDLDDLVGFLDISVKQAGARVSLDGRILRDLEDSDPIRVDPGRHTLTAEKKGRPASVRHVQVKAGETLTVVLSLEKQEQEEPGPDAREVIGYTLVGLGGASVVVGIVLGGVALNTKSEGEAKCAKGGDFDGFCSPEGADLLKSSRTEGVAATATLLAGVAVIAGGLGLALSVLADDEVEVSLAPGGVTLRGRW